MAPYHFWMSLLETIRDLCRGLPQDREVPEDRIPAQLVGVEFGRRALANEIDDPPSRTDHSSEEQRVTLSKQHVPLTEPAHA